MPLALRGVVQPPERIILLPLPESQGGLSSICLCVWTSFSVEKEMDGGGKTVLCGEVQGG